MEEWFYIVNDKQVGPVPINELKRLVEAGKLNSTDLIWKEGLPHWLPASEWHGLFTPKRRLTKLPPRIVTVNGNETSAQLGGLPNSNDTPQKQLFRRNAWIWSLIAGLALVCILLVATALQTAEQAKIAAEAAVAENMRLQKLVEAQNEQLNRPLPKPEPSIVAMPREDELISGLHELRKKMEAEIQSREKAYETSTVCRSCGGAGVYNYVDSKGELVTKSCPRCYGLGHTRGLFSK